MENAALMQGLLAGLQPLQLHIQQQSVILMGAALVQGLLSGLQPLRLHSQRQS